MIASICILIPPLLIVFFREKIFDIKHSYYARLFNYMFSLLFLNETMLFILSYIFKNKGNLFSNLNNHNNFAFKYILLSVVIALSVLALEYLCRLIYKEIKLKEQNEIISVASKNPISTDRQSAIEFLKVLAILLIVISHVTQTLHSRNGYVPYSGYVLNISAAHTGIQMVVLSMIRYLGALGNTIFFVCSAWFLIDSRKTNYKKILYMIADVWIISFIILMLFGVFYEGNIAFNLIRNSLFPTTFSNNWYLTYYMIFYAIHPILNNVIEESDKRRLLRISLFLGLLYIIVNYIMKGLFSVSVFGNSDLIIWVAIYFCVAYVKKYLNKLSANKNLNIFLSFIGLCASFGIVLLTNLFLLTSDFPKKFHLGISLLTWINNGNPFFILATIALLNLARMSVFKNKFINKISSLSLLIYIIHENILVRTYMRPFLLNLVHKHIGYDYIVLWVLLIAVLIFVCSAIAGQLYKSTLQKSFHYMCDKLYPVIRKTYIKMESCIIRLT